ncbi:short transient receptor potential channel 3-like [Amphiura filiformis]|uniref:short transient receptor potential channel 3-like n=1 Tax=Amphiura filiformis TaxID=82378 RepID=UPI003B228E81
MNNTNVQAEFLKAVEMNDVATVALLLQSSQRNEISLDVNAPNGDQQTPLVVAITSKHMELTSLLLGHGANSDDTLFYCIDTGCETMVKLICEHLKATSQDSLHRTLNTISTDENMKAVSSPLMYAAREDSQEIVKTLIEYGAEMPDLQTVLDHSKGDTYEQYLTCYSWHQAISSEAYLLYASNDPIQAAIDAGKAIRKSCSVQKQHLRSKYENLITRLDLFITKLFAMASSEDEIGALLWNREDNFNEEIFAQVGVLPQRIHDSLDLKYKQFISSTACTHFLLDQWYMRWKDLSVLHFTIWTAIVIIFQPVLCIGYLLLPFMWHRRIMKTPYVRFLLHWVSRIYFICLIVYCTLQEDGTSTTINFTESEVQRINQILKYLTFSIESTDILPVAILVYIWILGMTWREIRELCNGGFWNYWTDFFNYTDILQLILYWSALICYILSYNKVTDDVEYVCGLLSDIVQQADVGWSNYNVSDGFYVLLEEYTQEFTICDRFLAKGLTKRDTDEQVSFSMDPNDNVLMGDALFGVATVLSFLALMRDFDIVRFVGPLRVSFGRMISDMVRFVILFLFVWISFALGMTMLYSTYDTIETANCYHRDDYSCNLSAFTEFYVSLDKLFWSIFDSIDEEDIHLKSQYKITSIVGEVLYAVYRILVAVVMLNALIAMMSNTYTRVEENSDIKWKVARTNLMARYMANTTLPPPFNLLVTLKTVLNWIIAGCRRRCRHYLSDYHQPKNEIYDETVDFQKTTSYKTLVKTIVDRFVGTYVDSDDEIPGIRYSATKLSREMTEMKDSLKTMEKKIELILQVIQDHPST